MFEGQNLQYLKKGTANALPLTLSFWVKSTKTGTYILEIDDNDNSRNINKSYTVNTSNTWEKKTITFEGDTTGAFDNDNADSLRLIWWLASGTDNTSGTLQTTWGTTVAANRAVGQVNIADDTANDFLITGVQLEAGTSATDFEFLPIDVSLDRCERYFSKSYNLTTAPATATSAGNIALEIGANVSNLILMSIFFKNSMRAAPTMVGYSPNSGASGQWRRYNVTRTLNEDVAVTFAEASQNNTLVFVTMASSSIMIGHYTADAEL